MKNEGVLFLEKCHSVLMDLLQSDVNKQVVTSLKNNDLNVSDLYHYIITKKKDEKLTFERLILKAGEHLSDACMWSFDNISEQYEYFVKAKSIIELVETLDCGSIGGYDKDQQKFGFKKYGNLVSRWLWLFNKFVGTNYKIKISVKTVEEILSHYELK